MVPELQREAYVEPYITLQDTRYRKAISSRVRLLAFLYHIALGASYQVVSCQFGLGYSTVNKIVREVTRAILQHMWSVYIHRPNVQQARHSMWQWERDTGIPGIVGALDGTHIQIKRPGNRDVYFNRKLFYSINVQGSYFLFYYHSDYSFGGL